MRGCASIMLNLIQYTRIYLKKSSAESDIILNASDAVHSRRSLYKLLTRYQDRDYSEHYQTFKIEQFAKRIMREVSVHHQKRFRTRTFVELDASTNISSKTPEKKAPRGNIFEIVLLEALEITLWMENLTQRLTQSGSFFQKSCPFLQFLKRAGEVSPQLPIPSSSICTPVKMAEYASISLNMSKYPANASINCTNYARVLNMHDTVFEYGLIVYARITQSSEYIWSWSDYGSICLNNDWIAFYSRPKFFC